MVAPPIPAYVSPRSANALISELRPMTLAPAALLHLNLVLDELLARLVDAAGSISPRDFKVKGMPVVFGDVRVSKATATTTTTTTTGKSKPTTDRSLAKDSFRRDSRDRVHSLPSTPASSTAAAFGSPGGKQVPRHSASMHFRAIASSRQITKDAASLALGREAVNEAELELKAWRDRSGSKIGSSPGGDGGGNEGNKRDPKSLASVDGDEQPPFPVTQAVDLLRCRIMGYSTLGNEQPPRETVNAVEEAWVRAGGSKREDVICPAALYMTAIIEHISERILADIGRVVARSTSSTTAEMYDLYTALCEDEAVWGFFKRMQAKLVIEENLAITPHSTVYNLGRTITRDSTGSPLLTLPTALEGQGITATPTGGIRGPSLDLATPPNHQHHQRKLSLSGARTPSLDSPRPSLSSILNHKRSSVVLQRARSFVMGNNHNNNDTVASMVDVGSSPHRGSTSMDLGGERRSVVVPEDEFDALVASGQTLKVTLTPSRLKTFDSTRYQLNSSNIDGKVKMEGKGGTLRALSPIPGTLNSSTRSLPPDERSLTSSVGLGLGAGTGTLAPTHEESQHQQSKAMPRDERQLARKEEDTGQRGETLRDVLQSDPPWGTPSHHGREAEASNTPIKSNQGYRAPESWPRTLLPLGPPVRMEPRIESSPQSARRQVDSPVKARTEMSELVDFLKSTPPPAVTADDIETRQVSLNAEANKPDSALENAGGRLKTLVSRVTWNKSPEKMSNGSSSDSSLDRQGSPSSPNKLKRKPEPTTSNGKHPVLPAAHGLFSSRDRHIVDEYIGPSTIGNNRPSVQRDGGLIRSTVEVGSVLSTDGSSILAADTSSPVGANPDFYTPQTTPRPASGSQLPLVQPLLNVKADDQSRHHQVKESLHETGKAPAESIAIADLLQLKRSMALARSAYECGTLLDEMLRRYGITEE